MMTDYFESVRKPLTPNDVGVTGSHQAGVVIPRDPRMLAFFPPLDAGRRNPRSTIPFSDDDGREWRLNYIYYNGKILGFSTRNEYRLTGLTPFLRNHNASPGDLLELSRHPEERWGIRLITKDRPAIGNGSDSETQADKQSFPAFGVLETVTLSGTWSAVARRKNVR
ncbi:hypothetical protein CVO76_12745 [Arthrobacter agilis]|uniref:Restriction endonuclease type II EcoRII N-terminal domain-containing protein n=1 Tax=Arthrobacter agilis TaxID=37921 RepID=A0A2L0UGQ1_9MICC|nr:EcoRII N-terminal effector-binding domain-containing protein [Arthrobacter agilis]AUZ88406.1 hypothetical protein CVO76_12745 [Arthrobacter agilis]